MVTTTRYDVVLPPSTADERCAVQLLSSAGAGAGAGAGAALLAAGLTDAWLKKRKEYKSWINKSSCR